MNDEKKKVIVLPFPNQKFHIRKEGSQTYAPHPGTAIKIENKLYEIVNHYFKDEKHFYVLEPWNDSFTIRTIIEWNKEEEKKFKEEYLKEKKKEVKRKFAWAFQIFFGFLPPNYQEKLAEKIGLDPLKATFWSALFEFLFSLCIFVLNIISQYVSIYGTHIKFVPKWLVALSFLTLIEGMLRLIYTISSNEPIGSFLFSFLNLKFKRKKNIFQEDYFKETSDNLIVETPYEKKHWEEWGGINFNGQNYFLNNKVIKENFFIYNFMKTTNNYPEVSYETEKKYNTRSDSSLVFALLWGYLSKEFQNELKKFGRYKPEKFTQISFFFNLFASSVIFTSKISKILFSNFYLFDFFASIIALYLFIESLKRLINFYGKGEISGSFLGFLFKPLYHILFK